MTDQQPIITELYKGLVVIKFNPVTHTYYASIDPKLRKEETGQFIRRSGVTTIIGIKDKSRPLSIWQQQVTADFLLSKIEEGVKIDTDLALEAVVQNDVRREEAADIGKDIHAWCEAYIQNKLGTPGFENVPDIPKTTEATNGANSFLEWEKKHKVKFIRTETPVCSVEHMYFGTEDFQAVIDGVPCSGDFKSSTGLYNAVRLQTAAYAMAHNEESPRKAVKKRWAVRLAKYSEAEYYRREERKREMKKAIARIKGTTVKDYPPKPYQVFEAVDLDETKGFMARDFAAFLAFKAGFEWDRQTDAFYNGGSL